jgi:hypothetical protein
MIHTRYIQQTEIYKTQFRFTLENQPVSKFTHSIFPKVHAFYYAQFTDDSYTFHRKFSASSSTRCTQNPLRVSHIMHPKTMKDSASTYRIHGPILEKNPI